MRIMGSAILFFIWCVFWPAEVLSLGKAQGPQPPDWVKSSSSQYPESKYLTGVGYAKSRQQAEQRAYAAVARIFQADVHSQIEEWEEYLQLSSDQVRRKVWIEQVTQVSTEKVLENITEIAKKDLEDRIGRITAKAAARAATKYLLSQTIRKEVEDRGQTARVLTDLGTNLFSILTEQADTRSWQTLPGQIQMARLLLPPGTYDLEVRYLNGQGQEIGREVFGVVSVKASEKKFLGHRVLGPYVFNEDVADRRLATERIAEKCEKGKDPLCE